MEPTKEVKLERSESIVELAKSLAKFQGAVEAVTKDAENPFFHSRYATLAGIVSEIKKPLSENGIAYTQWPIGKNLLVTLLMHTSGEYIQATVEMTPKSTSPQDMGSCITYYRRYVLSSMLGIATEEDDDGNVASAKQPTTTTVKNVRAGGMDVYAQAVKAIDQAKTTTALFKLQEDIEKSEKLTDTQKDTLDKMISSRVDVLDNPQ